MIKKLTRRKARLAEWEEENPDRDVDLDFSDLDSDDEEFERPDSVSGRIADQLLQIR
jgi:hypothetical protein